MTRGRSGRTRRSCAGTERRGAVAGVLSISYNGVWGSSASGCLADRHEPRPARWTGSAWATPVTIPGTLLSIHGTGPNDVWVAGEPTYLRHYTGTWAVVMPAVAPRSTSSRRSPRTTCGRSRRGAGLATGTGATWTPYATDAFVDLHAFGPNDIWGVTQNKTGHWNGTSWTVTTPPGVTTSLTGVSGAGGHLWVVGASATILHRN